MNNLLGTYNVCWELTKDLLVTYYIVCRKLMNGLLGINTGLLGIYNGLLGINNGLLGNNK
jgi:hypothetical protein